MLEPWTSRSCVRQLGRANITTTLNAYNQLFAPLPGQALRRSARVDAAAEAQRLDGSRCGLPDVLPSQT
jgi:hypothetical protein